MQKTGHKATHWKGLATITLVALVMATVLVSAYVGFSQEGPLATVDDKITDRLAKQLTTILDKLDRELAQLNGDKFPLLEDQLNAISSLLDDLDSSLHTPTDAGNDRPTAKEQVIELDLMLHRLVLILEHIASVYEPTPTKSGLHETISDLRVWINGYIDGATADMGPLEARRYEKMARTLLSDIEKHIAQHCQQKKWIVAKCQAVFERCHWPCPGKGAMACCGGHLFYAKRSKYTQDRNQ
jgi:hypothetical protein